MTLKRKVYACLLLLILGVATSYSAKADKTKQALKALESGELAKTEEIVRRSIQRDGLSAGLSYVNAVLFAMEGFAGYDLDSAHHYVKESTRLIQGGDEKELEQLEKLGINEKTIAEQEQRVDEMLYGAFIATNSIEGFNRFLTSYEDSRFLDQVLKKRDSLAFEAAANTHTWQGYQTFMTDYPEAIERNEARRRYDELIFEERTGSGKLADLRQFIAEHSSSPYRHQVEQKIFDIIGFSADHQTLSSFLKSVSNPVLRTRGAAMLYHLGALEADLTRILGAGYRAFADSVSKLKSLNEKILLPILESQRYVFVDDQIESAVPGTFDAISKTYFCGGVSQDLLDVTRGNKHVLISRAGKTVFEGDFDFAEDIGFGLVRISRDDRYGLIHKGGWAILPLDYEQLSLVGGKLLKYHKGGKVGLLGLNGLNMVDARFDDIYSEGPFWIFEQNEEFAVVPFEAIAQGADGHRITPEFKYEEVELIDEEFLICYVEEREVLLNKDLEEVVPEGVQRINTKFATWVIKQPFGYRVFNKDLGEMTHTLYDQVLQNDQWLALKKGGKWSVLSKSIEDEPIIGVDSVKLLGDDIAMIFRGLGGMAIFPNKNVVEFTEGEELRSLTSGKNVDVHFLVIKRGGKNMLYKDGHLLFETDYDDIGFISDSIFYVKQGSKFGAVDHEGRLIMRVRYDGIAEATDGIAPVLYRGKFGAYNFNDNVLLALEYDERLSVYNDSLLITVLDGNKGLISTTNETILEPQYDEVVPWTDSLALLKQSGTWMVTNIYSVEQIYEGILDFNYVLDSDEKIIQIRTDLGYGIYSNVQGLIVPATYNDLINLGSAERPLYFGEKNVREAGFYVVTYLDPQGRLLHSQAYRDIDYELIVCEE